MEINIDINAGSPEYKQIRARGPVFARLRRDRPGFDITPGVEFKLGHIFTAIPPWAGLTWPKKPGFT